MFSRKDANTATITSWNGGRREKALSIHMIRSYEGKAKKITEKWVN